MISHKYFISTNILLRRKNNGFAAKDALIAPLVDQESRMGIVDIDYKLIAPDIVLSE